MHLNLLLTQKFNNKNLFTLGLDFNMLWTQPDCFFVFIEEQIQPMYLKIKMLEDLPRNILHFQE